MKENFDEISKLYLEGRVITFHYGAETGVKEKQRTRYALTYNEVDYALIYPDHTVVRYDSGEKLLSNATINGKSLRDVWDEVEFYEVF